MPKNSQKLSATAPSILHAHPRATITVVAAALHLPSSKPLLLPSSSHHLCLQPSTSPPSPPSFLCHPPLTTMATIWQSLLLLLPIFLHPKPHGHQLPLPPFPMVAAHPPPAATPHASSMTTGCHPNQHESHTDRHPHLLRHSSLLSEDPPLLLAKQPPSAIIPTMICHDYRPSYPPPSSLPSPPLALSSSSLILHPSYHHHCIAQALELLLSSLLPITHRH